MQAKIERPVIDRDTDLLEALRRGDATAAESLVSVFGDRAYRLAVGITGAPAGCGLQTPAARSGPAPPGA